MKMKPKIFIFTLSLFIITFTVTKSINSVKHVLHSKVMKVDYRNSSTTKKQKVSISKNEKRIKKLSKKSNKFPKLLKKDKLESEHKLICFNFKEIDKSQKFDVPYLFAELHTNIRTREGRIKPDYEQNQRLIEYQKAIIATKEKSKEKPQAKLTWIERGPGNVGGRTRAFLVDPKDTTHQTWFAGSVGGGIWKTTDRGVNWRNMTPFLPNLATTSLAYSASNPDIIYAGTGEGFMNLDAINGDGIFKSTDHGETWFHLPYSARFNSVNRIIVSPSDPNIVLCCANDMNVSGVQSQRYYLTQNSTIEKSTNGGISWRTVYSSGSNRIQQIVSDPNNFNVQYASVNGIGIIKSTNAGETWFNSSNGIGICQRIEMAISPTNPNKIYLSVENGAQSDFYISENAGDLWYLVNDIKKNNSWLGSQGWYDNCIAVHPFNENIVFVGGVNIFKIEMQSGQDSIFKITKIEKNGLDTYMTFFDGGLPFEEGGIGTSEDYWNIDILKDDEFVTTELRFGSNRSQKAHRFVQQGNEFIYKDYVNVPFEVQDLKNLKQLCVSFIDQNNNGKYDLLEGDTPEIIVTYVTNYSNQVNANIKNSIKYKASYVIMPQLKEGAVWNPSNVPNSKIKINWGPVYTKKRKTSVVTDGYGQFGGTNYNNIVHVDHHNITMIPINQTKGEYWMLIGNDGGVAYSTNEGVNWTETDRYGYNTSQFYGCDKKPGANEYIGGTQDNGTYFTKLGEDANVFSQYNYAIGGDGFEAIWHSKDTLRMLGSSQFNTLRKSTNGGISWFTVGLDITDGYNTGGPFVTKLAKSYQDPELVFAVGKSGVWRSENFGNSWQLIPIPDSLWRSGGYYSNAQVEISIADPQIIWAGVNMSDKGKLHLSTDGGLSFYPVKNYDLVPLGRISGIETHPYNEKVAYALFSFAKSPKILKTYNFGQNWIDISGFDTDSVSKSGFPDVAVYCLQVMPFDTTKIWVGTEIGLFETTDNGISWHYADNGLPPVSIWQMRIVDDQVVLATHGRGIWSVTLDELKDYHPQDVPLAPNIQRIGQSPNGKLSLLINLRSNYDSTNVYLKKQNETIFLKYGTILNKDIGTQKINLVYSVDTLQVLNIYLVAYKDGKEYKTGISTAQMYPLDEEKVTYFNDFEISNMGFGGNGFSIDTIPSFMGKFLQTVHKYPNNSSLINLLLTPIVVADTLAIMKYDDIAIVEPGEDGATWEQAEFYDYVIVEATKDGFDWIPLIPGYDANYDSLWFKVYSGATTLKQNMFRNHEIDLLNFFDKRDTILVRFRLYSDPGANGWGWAIDNLDIQPNGYLDVHYVNSNKYFIINAVYPNPTNENVNFDLSLFEDSNVKIEAFDLQGRKIEIIYNGTYTKGHYNVNWIPKERNNKIIFVKFTINDNIEWKKLIFIK